MGRFQGTLRAGAMKGHAPSGEMRAAIVAAITEGRRDHPPIRSTIGGTRSWRPGSGWTSPRFTRRPRGDRTSLSPAITAAVAAAPGLADVRLARADIRESVVPAGVGDHARATPPYACPYCRQLSPATLLPSLFAGSAFRDGARGKTRRPAPIKSAIP